jgi:NAD(P)-dependent dehydrogenase (short-subunit alcohol dehydrogenase family)
MDHEAVVITGAGGGLGSATAVMLAARGYPLVLTGRTRETLEQTEQLVTQAGGAAVVLPGDVSDEQHVEAVFAAADERFGGCEAVLHAAATHGTPTRLTDVPLSEWELVMSTNLRSTFLVTRAALRRMVPARRGSIVLVSSAGVLRGFPLAAPYAATKSALIGYARTLAAEVSPDGVRVNVLTPGAMPQTAIFHSAMPGIAHEMGFDEEQMIPLLEGMSALRRPCTCEEIARAAVFMLTEDASAMTGQNLVVDAGLTT